MKILDVLFYYYYLIYTKKITTTTPLETTIFCLGASIGFELLCIIYFILIFFCLKIGKYVFFVFEGLPIVALYFLYWKNSRYKKVLKQKPKFYNSHKKTKVIVGVFFVFTASSLVWQPVLIEYLVKENIDCKQKVVVEEIVKEKFISLFGE